MDKISRDEQIEGIRRFPPGARPAAWIGRLNKDHQNYIDRYGPGSPPQHGTLHSVHYHPYECPESDRVGLDNAREQYWIMQWQYEQVRAAMESAIGTVVSTTATTPRNAATQEQIAAITPLNNDATPPEASELPGISAGGDLHSPAAPSSTRELLGRKETANYLTGRGYHITQKTLANWASEGKGPRFTKLGGKSMYERSDVEDWLQKEFAAAGSEK
jgi:hypothetical protein